MVCPKCGSDELVVKRRIGLEELIRFFTDKPKYRCERCRFAFRAQKHPHRRTLAQKSQAITR